jgi:hypothetical protein
VADALRVFVPTLEGLAIEQADKTLLELFCGRQMGVPGANGGSG